MYLVTANNGEGDIYLNVPSTNNNAQRITGTIKKGINVIDSFSFAIYPNNIAYSQLQQLKTKVRVFNEKTNKLEFIGRVLMTKPKMDSNGLLLTNVVCESELGYLMDSVTKYGEYHDIGVRDFLQIIIENHNAQVSEDKHFTVGKVEITGTLYRYLGYEESLSAIKDKLIERLGGELSIRYENGVRYLDYLLETGVHTSTEIRLAKNLLTIEQEKDPTQVVPRIIPLGAKMEDSDERITIASINDGIDYIDDVEAIETFGLVAKSVTWDDVNYPDILMRKAKEYQIANNRILKKHKIDAVDLSSINLDIDSYEVGNYYPVINPLMNINEELRVIEKTIVVESPEQSSLTIGDKFEDIKDYQLGMLKSAKSVEVLRGNISSTVTIVGEVNTELQNTVASVTQIGENLNTTNTVVLTHNQALIDLSNQMLQTMQEVSNLKETTSTISEKVSTNGNNIDRLNKRLTLGV
ncbi:phage tail spike protein [Turicibacter sanguinis]|uniref:phage tail spike protein n=1 Tax=Turicibacter sanguinis TaxID=154288 RepID=UPI0018A9160F|nr:phage tail spike protein [Turicibacter sanguinis]MDB8552153.1 phage tail protein [Turicibacter sanguinis]